MEYVIIGVFVVVIVGVCIYSFITANKIKKDGVEAEGVISKINVNVTQTVDNDGVMVDTDTTKIYFVKFNTSSGEEIEAKLINPDYRLREGDTINIKYLPEKPDKVLRIK
ncbi:MAG: hypothetical protein IJ572_05430 [Bacilli bacterium]|nr:hypothetical protein [Bacilli bacterium]